MMFVNLGAGLLLLHLGAEIFLPIAIAFVLTTALRPLVHRLEGTGVPTPVGAGIVVVTGLAIIWTVGYQLTPAVTGFVRSLPEVATAAGAKLQELPRPLDRLGVMVSSAAAEMTRPAVPTDSAGSVPRISRMRAPSAVPPPATGFISSAFPVLTQVFGAAAGMVSGFAATMLLLFFFLASGDTVRRRLMQRAADSPFARAVVEIADELQLVVSKYLSILSVINIVQGTIIATAMAIIGMPVPLVWGAMTFVAEFFPYLGAVAMFILLTLVGLADSTRSSNVLLAPLIYLTVTSLQNSLVSPVTYGKFLRLAPPAILVSVMVWWLIWGVFGAFLAVPILALIRIICDREKGKLAVLGALVGGEIKLGRAKAAAASGSG